MTYDKIHSAADAGDLGELRRLLDGGADIDEKDNDGWTALHWVANQGHTACARFLLDSGADIDAEDVGGWTALYLAALKGKTRVMLEKTQANRKTYQASTMRQSIPV